MLFRVPVLPCFEKNIFLVLIMMLMATSGFGQKEGKKAKKVYFSIGPEFALPLGNFNRESTFGLGGSALLEVKASQPVGITLGLCYIHYFPKNKPVYSGVATDQLAAILGARYYFDKHFFVSGQAGFSVHQDEYREIDGSVVIAPGIGFKYGLVDVTLKYMSTKREYSNISGIGIRLAVAF